MGHCMGHCLPNEDNPFISHANSVDFTYLIEGNVPPLPQVKKRNFLAKLFARRKSRKKIKKPVLELVDGFINPQVTSYCRLNESQRLPSTSSYNSKDIPLQCLDARALLARTQTSTPASSLDLEWEHETLPISMVHDASGSSWTALPDDDLLELCPSESSILPICVANSESDWSRVSSVNSLEWDNVQHTFNPSTPVLDIDTDTQLLLSEIERLTSQTLEETGRELLFS